MIPPSIIQPSEYAMTGHPLLDARTAIDRFTLNRIASLFLGPKHNAEDYSLARRFCNLAIYSPEALLVPGLRTGDKALDKYRPPVFGAARRLSYDIFEDVFLAAPLSHGQVDTHLDQALEHVIRFYQFDRVAYEGLIAHSEKADYIEPHYNGGIDFRKIPEDLLRRPIHVYLDNQKLTAFKHRTEVAKHKLNEFIYIWDLAARPLTMDHGIWMPVQHSLRKFGGWETHAFKDPIWGPDIGSAIVELSVAEGALHTARSRNGTDHLLTFVDRIGMAREFISERPFMLDSRHFNDRDFMGSWKELCLRLGFVPKFKVSELSSSTNSIAKEELGIASVSSSISRVAKLFEAALPKLTRSLKIQFARRFPEAKFVSFPLLSEVKSIYETS